MTHSGARYSVTAALLMALSVAPAAAQARDAETGIIDQVQLGDVWANMNVELPDPTAEAAVTATAVGNTAAAQRNSGNVTSETYQVFGADSVSESALSGERADTAVVTSTAYGNAASGGTSEGTDRYYAEQSASGAVTASSGIGLRGTVDTSSATTAIANVSATDNAYGTQGADQGQYSEANVSARTEADITTADNSATFATTAGANATSATGYTSTNYNRARQAAAEGSSVDAVTEASVAEGKDVTAVTTGFGNSASVINEWGYAALGLEGAPTEQSNDASINAETDLTLGDWSGYATASAYGVGNSALISNTGSDTAIYADQYNGGTVTSEARFTGQSATGGIGVLSSTAIGNATTASLCNYCGSDSSAGGSISQVNAGQVRAYGRSQTGSTGAVIGAATAVGNAATLQSTGN
ncbi:holdfast anchor protein HfaD [Henriciella aquimarina]|uniref:holdfast anchor protein HfaD n=1 Tax=Henriciella aquimarina TaxID=545261 RepID=UPI00117AA66E|nr:holdfast anchor protein HfaD [Henriciella aquimarina]